MSEQEQGTPVWHAFVGDGWMPVRIGEETRSGDEALTAGGWAEVNDSGSFVYKRFMMPRRRREASWEIVLRKDGVDYCRVKAVKPGECFVVNEYGELAPVEVEE